ncbi:hypothetical protein Poly30_53780 [Planctomycetes bacterium Poly30]|uniref:Uncharacterized protein n=1 Tax=Saltatorellus ferox TaxID=2528018 RepID=A0A518F0F1_9BACT|nr:hypothetical protein Poly30_53780 [Planctomycetes bacterium Poly30]
MGKQPHITPIGSTDSAGSSVAVALPPGEKAHGDIVVEAISGRTRLLIAAVMSVNLMLGLWLISRADFSQFSPQGAAERPAATVAHSAHEPRDARLVDGRIGRD